MSEYPGPRWHAKVEWEGDSPEALQRAKDEKYKYIDQNAQFVFLRPGYGLAGTAFVMHWPDPQRNNFTYVVDEITKKTRKMTRAELRGRVNEFWDADGVRRWRRDADTNSDRPRSYATHAMIAAGLGITIVLELKNTAFAHKEVAQQLHDSATKHAHRPVFMALWGLAKCREKTAAFVSTGSEFAVIYGASRAIRPLARLRIKRWAVKPTWD